ncbi:hypothetical protein [Shewanella sp. UCD-KL12]|uniref:hypothetical protein n=1 Tax=Shewanella sp. UCD-KL12 TaxID=1917163 RepID=UPI0027415903|nr:hypothetical protein [Shewanella sp. UCD-KL12]
MLPVNLASCKASIIALFLMFACIACTPEKKQETTPLVIDNSLCNFHYAACTKQVDNIQLSLLITPLSTPSEKPLTLTISSSEPISNVKVHVEGRDMFMGIIPVNITQTNETEYNGEFIFGSCSSNYMVWRTFVSFIKNGEQHVAIFDFLADNNKINK